jgi:hypothetical protein
MILDPENALFKDKWLIHDDVPEDLIEQVTVGVDPSGGETKLALSRPRFGNRTPMAAWREGISSGSPETALDMMLRSDNAKALPTCPQPQHQQQQIAA